MSSPSGTINNHRVPLRDRGGVQLVQTWRFPANRTGATAADEPGVQSQHGGNTEGKLEPSPNKTPVKRRPAPDLVKTDKI